MNRYDQRMQELGGEIVRVSLGAQPITLTEDELQNIEQTIGHPLPDDYREFVRNYGGYAVYAFFRGVELDDWGSICVFYGLMPKEPLVLGSSPPFSHMYYPLYAREFDLLFWHDALRPYKPTELLCIADDDSNPVCLAIAGDSIGSIYYWDRSVAWQTSDYTGISLVAHSFDEFMQLLKNEDE